MRWPSGRPEVSDEDYVTPRMTVKSTSIAREASMNYSGSDGRHRGAQGDRRATWRQAADSGSVEPPRKPAEAGRHGVGHAGMELADDRDLGGADRTRRSSRRVH